MVHPGTKVALKLGAGGQDTLPFLCKQLSSPDRRPTRASQSRPDWLVGVTHRHASTDGHTHVIYEQVWIYTNRSGYSFSVLA